MYMAGIVMTAIGVLGIIITLIWIIVGNRKKDDSRQQEIEEIKNRQYQYNNFEDKVVNINNRNLENRFREEEFDLTEGLNNDYPTQNINNDMTQLIDDGSETEFLMTDSLLNMETYTEQLVPFSDESEDTIQDNLCPNCKKPVRENAKFCGSCGQKLI